MQPLVVGRDAGTLQMTGAVCWSMTADEALKWGSLKNSHVPQGVCFNASMLP
jgi:hypothetical protein